jgi:D-alanine-D-alanine ligase
LISKNINSRIIDIKDKNEMHDEKAYQGIDFALVMIHGKGGEDGEVQEFLTSLNIKFSGSDIEGLKNSYDKVLTKQIWSENKINTPQYVSEIFDWSDLPDFLKKTSKLVIKPSKEGSSLGVSIIKNDHENFSKAIKHAKKYEGTPIIEEFIPGRELTISVLGDLICDPIEIEAQEEFYNFEAKYNRTDTSYIFPIFAEDKLAKLKKLSKNAFDLLGCNKWGRVDLIEYEDKFYFIEVNTVPGMTETSLVPKSAEKEGLSFYELIKKIIMDSIDN